MAEALFLLHGRLVEVMHLVGATAHKGESARLATLGCRGFEQRQKFGGQESVGVVIDLYDSLVAGLAELIGYDVHTAVPEQDIESIQVLLDFGREIDDAGLVVEVEGHDSDVGTWFG